MNSKEKLGQWFGSKLQKEYMITSRHQNVVWSQNITIENLSFENEEKFKYLRVTVTNTNDICEEIKWEVYKGWIG